MKKKKKRTKPEIAVALHYDGKDAPRVTAKGQGKVAQRIMEIARESNVPLHEDQHLVQVLSMIELGDEVPETLYRAVAEVIAFAYYLSGKMPGETN